jgi:hypothetical protein
MDCPHRQIPTSSSSPHNGTTRDYLRFCHVQCARLEPLRGLGQTRHPSRPFILPLPSYRKVSAPASHRPLASQHSMSRQLYPLKSLRRRCYRRSAYRNPPKGQELGRPTYGYEGEYPSDKQTLSPHYPSPQSYTMATCLSLQASLHCNTGRLTCF